MPSRLPFSSQDIPTHFDDEIPLLRAEERMQEEGLRLLHFYGISAQQVFSMLRFRQEYLLIDLEAYLQRPDLVLLGRTVFGVNLLTEENLEDVCSENRRDFFLRNTMEEAASLGVSIKIQPREIIPPFERSSLAIAHNLFLMQLMKKSAEKQGFACLFHEKPFAGIHGLEKLCDWSIYSDAGINLLDPQDHPLVFLTLLSAIIHAMYENAPLLQVGHRAFVHVEILKEEAFEGMFSKTADGNAFFIFSEKICTFRALPISPHCAFAICTLNAVIADSLHLLLDELQDAVKDRRGLSVEEQRLLILPILRKKIQEAQEAYSAPKDLIHALAALLDRKTIRCFQGILSAKELSSRYEALVKLYVQSQEKEAHVMLDCLRTKIVPAALYDQKQRAKSLIAVKKLDIPFDPLQIAFLEKLSLLLGQAMTAAEQVEKILMQIEDLGWEAKAKVFSEIGTSKMADLRFYIDSMEEMVDHALWPMPKYQELLYGVQ